ncbi:FHA domain-containing protein [Proteiniclasticum sp.]|uniref:FHA domain-containing protein n=1 Tax=Proteiniclasticum sp. TaxID=2053595 RepID=UPI00289AAEAE|nr:FHA domain-containing protein [Proteiniclasticum sp.]
MDIERFIGLAFTGFFVIILFFIIIRSLFLMSRDMDSVEEVKEKSLRLTILKSGENRNLKEGAVISIVNETTFGRKNDNTVVLTDPYVSGYHFRIFPKEGRFVIEDNQSTNGTLLNGEKLEMKTYLKKEDIIKVGNLTLKVNVS